MSRGQERTLLVRLEAARQVRVTCLGAVRQRVRLVRESKAFQWARTLSQDDPERKRLFAQARAQHAFSDYALQAYAQPFLHSWLGEHLDSHVLQKLASRASGAAKRVLVGRAKRVRRVGQASARQRGGQGQHQRHALVWGPRGVAGARLARPAG